MPRGHPGRVKETAKKSKDRKFGNLPGPGPGRPKGVPISRSRLELENSVGVHDGAMKGHGASVLVASVINALDEERRVRISLQHRGQELRPSYARDNCPKWSRWPA